MARKKLGALLEQKGFINEFQLVAALSHQRKWKTKIGQSLIELGFLEEDQLYQALSEQFDLPLVNLRKLELPPEVLKFITRDRVKQFNALPIKKEGNAWTVAVSDPEAPDLMNNLSAWLDGEINLVLATTLDLETKTRKIPDKVQVASLQPVKKAFVKNHNGELLPFEDAEPTPPPRDEPVFLDDQGLPPPAEDESPVEIGLPLEDMTKPEGETIEVPETPEEELSLEEVEEVAASEQETELEAPDLDEPGDEEVTLPPLEDAPLAMPDAEEPAGAEEELPPIEDAPLAMPDAEEPAEKDDTLTPIEEAPPLVMDEAPPLGEDELLPSGDDEVPLEAPHETAAAIPPEETPDGDALPPLEEAPPLVMDEAPPLGEDELLPSGDDEVPLEAPHETAAAIPPEETPDEPVPMGPEEESASPEASAVDLEELLPPTIETAEPGELEEAPPLMEAPPLEDLPPESREPAEPAPETQPGVDSEEVLSADEVWQSAAPPDEELPEEPPGLDDLPGPEPLEDLPPESREPAEPAPETPPGVDSEEVLSADEVWQSAAPPDEELPEAPPGIDDALGLEPTEPAPEAPPPADEEVLSADEVWQSAAPPDEELPEAPPGLDDSPGPEPVEPPPSEEELLTGEAAPEPEAPPLDESLLTQVPEEPELSPPSLDDLSLAPPDFDDLSPPSGEPGPDEQAEPQPAPSMNEIFKTPEPPLEQDTAAETETLPETAPEETPAQAAAEDMDPEAVLSRIGELQKQIQDAAEEINHFKEVLATKPKPEKK